MEVIPSGARCPDDNKPISSGEKHHDGEYIPPTNQNVIGLFIVILFLIHG